MYVLSTPSSVDSDGNVYLWDAKSRSNSVQNSASRTFSDPGRRAQAITKAREIIDASHNLDDAVKTRALANLGRGQVRFRTAYAKVGTPGWRIIKGTR